MTRSAALRGAFALALVTVALVSNAWADKLSAKDWRQLEEDVSAWVKSEPPRDVAKARELLSRAAKDQSVRFVNVAAKLCEVVDEEAFTLEAGASLGAVDVDAVKREVRKQAAASKVWRARQACVVACAKHLPEKNARGVVEKALEDPQLEVALVAVRAIAKLKTNDAVDALVNRMDKLDGPRGPVWEELRDALGELLGRRLGSGAEYRARWLELKPKGGLSAVGAAEEPPAPTGAGEGPRTVSMFGREVCSLVVIVLDISESMLAVDDATIPIDDEGTRSRDPQSTEKKVDPRSRIARAKRELKRVLKAMPKEARINLVAYSTATRLWRGAQDGKPPRLHALDGATREDATKWVDGLEAHGTTATDEALDRAFDVEGVRCIYLLSDGQPTKDGTTPIPTETILSLIEKRNKDRGVRIHTLGFVGADQEFMRAVAKATGGAYSDIK